jgi:hypothetical protein
MLLELKLGRPRVLQRNTCQASLTPPPSHTPLHSKEPPTSITGIRSCGYYYHAWEEEAATVNLSSSQGKVPFSL